MGEQVAAGFIWGCSSVGRAPALQAGGQEFESLHLHVSNEQCSYVKTDTEQVYLRGCMDSRINSAKQL